jgi:hypothetical protein
MRIFFREILPVLVSWRTSHSMTSGSSRDCRGGLALNQFPSDDPNFADQKRGTI